jgi:hypothetical protein
MRVLGERWARLAVIPEQEMQAIEAVAAARAPLSVPERGAACTHHRRASRRRRGILVEVKPLRGYWYSPFHLLQRSVGVVVDGTDAAPTT